MAGRPPKPSKLKLLEGNRGKRKIKVPPPAAGSPVPTAEGAPSWLSPEAAAIWPEVIAECGPILTRAHTQALAILCSLLAQFRRLDREGKTSTKVAGECRQYFSRFGMTEADLARLGAEEKKPETAGDVPPDLRDASGG